MFSCGSHFQAFLGLMFSYGRLLHDLFADTEAEEVGHGLHHGVLPTEVGVTAAAVHQLSHIDLVPLHGLRGGDHLLGAGAHQNQGHP